MLSHIYADELKDLKLFFKILINRVSVCTNEVGRWSGLHALTGLPISDIE